MKMTLKETGRERRGKTRETRETRETRAMGAMGEMGERDWGTRKRGNEEMRVLE
jgi:hypothetical protein